MFGTRNIPCFWLDNGVAHGCSIIGSSQAVGEDAGFLTTPLHPVGSWDADGGIINLGFILTVRF